MVPLASVSDVMPPADFAGCRFKNDFLNQRLMFVRI